MAECEQEICKGTASHRVFWPGRIPLLVCEPCKDKVVGIGQSMGCLIHTEPMQASYD